MDKTKLLNILSPVLLIFTTVLVILFSRGWRLDIQEGTVVNTGILDISSEPRGAQIFIDGLQKGKTPTVIDSLLPGKYQLELRKDLYTSWTKEITIKEEYVTKIVANLFEEENELTQITDQPVEDVIFSELGNEALILNKHNGNQGLWKIQLNQSFFQSERSKTKIINLVEPGYFDLLKSEYKIIPNENFSKAILKVNNDREDSRYFLLNLMRGSSEITDITEYLYLNEDFLWLKDNITIAIEQTEKLMLFNTNDFSLSVLSNWPVLTWSAGNNFIYFINNNPLIDERKVFKTTLDGLSREELIIEGEIEMDDISSIYFNQGYLSILFTTSNRTYLYNLKTNKVVLINEESLRSVSTSPNERYVLLSRDSETIKYVYDFEENLLKEYNTQAENLNVEKLKWSPNGLKIFYRYTLDTGNNKIVSMDYDGSNFYELINFTEYQGRFDSSFGFKSDSKEIFFPLPVNTEDLEHKNSWEEYIFKLQLR